MTCKYSGCKGLTSITIPGSVTSIGSYVFANCSGLTSITIPNSVTSIGDCAFKYCSSLTSITIPNSVTSIGNDAFDGCENLASITIPNSVTSIGNYVFYDCYRLTSITIPGSVTSIGDFAFSYCSSLASIIIPSSVTSIGVWAFRGCSSLTSITIPNGVTCIEEQTFYECSSLASITIPSSVTSIGDHAFEDCSSLTSITIPNGVTSIGDCAFRECSSLTSITIPKSVTSIGVWAFRGCSSLTDVYCYAENVPKTDPSAFTSSPIASATLHVPAASLEQYKATAPWSGFGSIVPARSLVDINLYDIGDNTDILQENEHKYVNVTINGRTFKKDGTWQGICLPFDVDVENSILKGADVRTLESLTQIDNYILMNCLTPVTEMKAGTPYIIRWKDAGEDIFNPYFESVTINLDDWDVYVVDGTEVGVCNRTFGSGSYLIYSSFECNYNEEYLWLMNGTSVLTPITADAGLVVHAFDIMFNVMDIQTDDTVVLLNTGDPIDLIDGISSLKEEEGEVEIYNVAGMRLNKMQRGINIVNRRKVLIR